MPKSRRCRRAVSASPLSTAGPSGQGSARHRGEAAAAAATRFGPTRHRAPAAVGWSRGAEPPRTNNPSCRLRSRRTAKAWALQDSVYPKSALANQTAAHSGTGSRAGGSPHSPHVITPCPATAGTPNPRNPPGPASPCVPPGRSGSRSGWAQCRGWVRALSPRGSHAGDIAQRPAVGWAPPALPPPHRQHPSGTIPVCRTRHPHPLRVPHPLGVPHPLRVPRPSASRAALTCPRSAQAEPPPLPLPPAPSFTSAPFW